MSLEYTTLFDAESAGEVGAFGIKIQVAACPSPPHLRSDKIIGAAYKAADLVRSEVMAAMKAADKCTPAEIENNKKLIGLFPAPIFAEEIPNGYCDQWCCRHLPWFVVTTTIGRFKIGWRKRVINIDWSETRNTDTAVELFAEENVTKAEKYIHAWSIEDAKRYIQTVISSTAGGEE